MTNLSETELREIEKRNSQLVCSTHNVFYTKTVSVEDGVPIWCCPECLKQTNTPPDVAALTATVRELQRQVATYRGALVHIAEYWNRDQNEAAMADALWHIIETADAAMTKEQTP